MAGDWIKWTKGLAKRREVVVMASRLKRDRHEIAGRLMELWEWCDDNITIADVPEMSLCVSLVLGDKPFEFVDALLGLPGMAEAMSSPEVKWLECRSGGRIVFPNLARHNGTSAKARAYETSKKQKQRQAKNTVPASVPKMSPNSGDKTGTREEKRREDSNTEETNADTCEPDDSGFVAVPRFCVLPGVTAIEISGQLVEYHEDPLRWEAEFIRRWNSLIGITQRAKNALDAPLRSALQARLLDPDWKWQRAFAAFPIVLDVDFPKNLTWFLKPGTVSSILDGTYERGKGSGRTNKTRLPGSSEATRVRTGETSSIARAAFAAAAARNGSVGED